MPYRFRWPSAVLLMALAFPALSQVTVPDEYGKRIQQHSAVGTLGDDLAGDQIDLSSGRLTIVQTDIDLPGNNALPVRVARRFQPADVYNTGHFGMWSLDIPNVHGTFGRFLNSHWPVSSAGAPDYNRCSHFGPPPEVLNQDALWEPNEYWQGSFLYGPGSGDRELLAAARAPNDGKTYYAGTKEGDAVSCVPLAPTSISGSFGEGFEVHTPSGLVYTLNQMVTRNQAGLRRSSYAPSPRLTAIGRIPPSTGPTPQAATHPGLSREDVILFPTKIADRFGNTVTYTWSSTNPWQLLRISASDGRQLDFTYASATSNEVTRISDGTRNWAYTYGTDTDTLTLPDGTMWSYRLSALFHINLKPSGTHCDSVNGSVQRAGFTSGSGSYTGSITAPSGATVSFSMDRILLGRSHVFYTCLSDTDSPDDAYPTDPYLFMTAAVVSKTITGPGMPAGGYTWNYAYGPTNNCWDGPTWAQGVKCSTSSPATRLVDVSDPNGDVTRYTFGNHFNLDEGLLQKTQYGWNGSTALRTTTIDYAAPDAPPYANHRGWSIRQNGDMDMTAYKHPVRQTTTTQQGRTFTWRVASDCTGVPYCFDAYARPTKVVKESSP